jgi:hypothetical protein
MPDHRAEIEARIDALAAEWRYALLRIPARYSLAKWERIKREGDLLRRQLRIMDELESLEPLELESTPDLMRSMDFMAARFASTSRPPTRLRSADLQQTAR